MKKYHDSCQSTVALRKRHKQLLQHITSRGLSTRSTQAERPTGVLLRPGRTNPLPRDPPSVLWPHPGHRMMCGGDTVRTVPAGCYRTLFGPLTRLHHPLPPLVAPTNRALCAPLTLFPAQEQHAVSWCTPAPPPPALLLF